MKYITPVFYIWAILFLVSAFLFFKSLKKKIWSQSWIYGICFSLTVWAIFSEISSSVYFSKDVRKSDRLYFENMAVGDTATFTGRIAFRIYDNYAIQDTMDRIEKENELSTGKSYFNLALSSVDKKQWHLKVIVTDIAGRDSLSKFLNYAKQKSDTLTYVFTIKAVKIDKDEIWKLLHVFSIDSVKETPQYWH